MLYRILYAYLGGIGLPILFLPVALWFPLAGHALMYTATIAAPIGTIAALSITDFIQRYQSIAVFVRSVVGVFVFVLLLIVVAILSDAGTSAFLKNKGWIAAVFVAPFVSAVVTDRVMTTRKRVAVNVMRE